MDIDLKNAKWDLDKIPEFGKGKEFAKETELSIKQKLGLMYDGWEIVGLTKDEQRNEYKRLLGRLEIKK